jgi:transcriptional adapter 3
MSSKFTKFHSQPPIRSVLFKSPPESVPPTEDLEELHEELRRLRQQALDRAKKASRDLKTIEESMRRMKEREKGKAKAVEKIKRERGGGFVSMNICMPVSHLFIAQCFLSLPF